MSTSGWPKWWHFRKDCTDGRFNMLEPWLRNDRLVFAGFAKEAVIHRFWAYEAID